MKYDDHGQAHCDVDEACELLYCNPELNLSALQISEIAADRYNLSVSETFSGFEKVVAYAESNETLQEFDTRLQSQWHMPAEYKQLDIAQWLLDQCNTQEELQRVGKELLLYQDRNLFDLLRQLKYTIDTWRANDIVWGVGRGSSVASYVLYLLGVHRINSMYYDLDVEEFLR
jgi:DNA polymerase III alpha subunit